MPKPKSNAAKTKEAHRKKAHAPAAAAPAPKATGKRKARETESPPPERATKRVKTTSSPGKQQTVDDDDEENVHGEEQEFFESEASENEEAEYRQDATDDEEDEDDEARAHLNIFQPAEEEGDGESEGAEDEEEAPEEGDELEAVAYLVATTAGLHNTVHDLRVQHRRDQRRHAQDAKALGLAMRNLQAQQALILAALGDLKATIVSKLGPQPVAAAPPEAPAALPPAAGRVPYISMAHLVAVGVQSKPEDLRKDGKTTDADLAEWEQPIVYPLVQDAHNLEPANAARLRDALQSYMQRNQMKLPYGFHLQLDVPSATDRTTTVTPMALLRSYALGGLDPDSEAGIAAWAQVGTEVGAYNALCAWLRENGPRIMVEWHRAGKDVQYVRPHTFNRNATEQVNDIKAAINMLMDHAEDLWHRCATPTRAETEEFVMALRKRIPSTLMRSLPRDMGIPSDEAVMSNTLTHAKLRAALFAVVDGLDPTFEPWSPVVKAQLLNSVDLLSSFPSAPRADRSAQPRAAASNGVRVQGGAGGGAGGGFRNPGGYRARQQFDLRDSYRPREDYRHDDYRRDDDRRVDRRDDRRNDLSSPTSQRAVLFAGAPKSAARCPIHSYI